MSNEMIETTQPKSVMINPSYNSRKNRERIAREEEELEELMNGKPKDDAEDTPPIEEPIETEELAAEDDKTPLSKEEETFKKRYGDLRRHQSKTEADLKARITELEGEPAKGFAPPKSNEDLEAWAKKYPDVAGIVESIATKKAQEMFEKTSSRFKELDDLTYETKRTKAETEIRKTHADFDALKAADDFHDWAEDQPSWIKNALYDNEDDASGVIRVIDLYKIDKGMTPAAKKAKVKDAASDVKSKSTPALDVDGEGKRFSESQVAKESDAWYEKNADKIQEAMNTGNFVYDITRRK